MKKILVTALVVVGVAAYSVIPVYASQSVRTGPPGCSVIERGFTPFKGSSYHSSDIIDGVSVGLVLRNRTRTDVSMLALRINAYGSNGRLLHSQEPAGPRSIAAGQVIYTGYEFETTESVASIKIVSACRPATAKVPKSQSAGGQWVDDAESSSGMDFRGTFTNRQKSNYFGNVTFIIRDGNGRIIGGTFANAPGYVPKGTDVMWDTWSHLFRDFPPGKFAGVTINSSVAPN